MGLETLALAGLAAGVAGAGVSAVGSIVKGQSTQQADNFNASVDETRAQEEIDQSKASTQDYIRKGSNQETSAVADQGASGVTGSGSPLMVDEDTVRQVALGASRTRQGGQLRAARLRDDATLQRMGGANAVTASYLDAGSSLLTGASKIGAAYGNPKASA